MDGYEKNYPSHASLVSSDNIKGMSVIDDTHDFQSNILLQERRVDRDSQQRGGIK